MMRQLETPEELVREMASRQYLDAVSQLVDWLRRRDDRSADLASEQLAENLEALAAELRGEAVQTSTARTAGLMLAAVVLRDTARDIRAGDEPAASSTHLEHAA
jgi:hypothetical protein